MIELFKLLVSVAVCTSLFASCDWAARATAPDEVASNVACLDEQGNAVDWYIGYKFPKIKDDERFDTGYSYAYITSDDVGQQQEQVRKSMEMPDHVDGHLSFFLYRFRDLLLRYTGLSSTDREETKVEQEETTARQTSTRKAKKQVSSNGEKNIKPKATRWSLSNLRVTDENSALMRTLRIVYDSERVDAILYNDDAGDALNERKDDGDESDPDENLPDPASSTRRKRREANKNDSSKAHAKGVLMLDQKTNRGVWVTHSLPRFPSKLGEPLRFPESAQHYGQTFMCVTFDLNKAGSMVVEHLRTMRPQVYDRRVSAAMYEQLPNLRDLDTTKNLKAARRGRISVKPKLAQVITTTEGQVLNLFSKSKNFRKDLYAGWIDEELGSALYVETWRRGAGTPLNSSCPSNEYHVNNVKELRYDDKANWSYLKDHSKWAISDEEQHAFVCLGDSNRMESQFSRGGGAICLKCPACWKIFSGTILDVEPCPLGARATERKASDADRGLLHRIAQALHL